MQQPKQTRRPTDKTLAVHYRMMADCHRGIAAALDKAAVAHTTGDEAALEAAANETASHTARLLRHAGQVGLGAVNTVTVAQHLAGAADPTKPVTLRDFLPPSVDADDGGSTVP